MRDLQDSFSAIFMGNKDRQIKCDCEVCFANNLCISSASELLKKSAAM